MSSSSCANCLTYPASCSSLNEQISSPVSPATKKGRIPHPIDTPVALHAVQLVFFIDYQKRPIAIADIQSAPTQPSVPLPACLGSPINKVSGAAPPKSFETNSFIFSLKSTIFSLMISSARPSGML